MELARKKQPVELKQSKLRSYEYRLKEIAGSIARFVIECSSGTYIRSLAHEMGQKRGVCAHLAEITRTAVGEFFDGASDHARGTCEASKSGKFADCLIPLESLLSNFPRVNVLPVLKSACVTDEIQHYAGAASAGPRRASSGSDDPARWRGAEAAAARVSAAG